MRSWPGVAWVRAAAPAISVGVALVACVAPVAAQTDNVCDTGEAPDIIVGHIGGSTYWGTVGGISGYSFGTISCNLGTCQADWIAESNRHPVIAQNLFRLKDGRFEQIGQSWVKHGFATIPLTTCSADCLPTDDDQHLGVNCSDPYGSGLNGYQEGMGPKFDVRGLTGEFPWPPTDYGVFGDAIYKRLQVHDVDVDPALNPEALYFVEAQYVSRDDAIAGNQDDNASFRPAVVSIDIFDGTFRVTPTGSTEREKAAIYAWQAADPAVLVSTVDFLGRYLVGARVSDLGNGTWRYEYAIQNLNADGALGFTVRVNGGSQISNIGFHDVDYHSGDPHDGTDWPGTFDPRTGKVDWTAPDETAGLLRWGTLYNFRFDADRSPVLGEATLRFFPEAAKAAGPGSMQTWVPQACDDDGTCDAGEDCHNCPGDCAGIGASGFCGDGLCDPMSGEDCVSCAQDCNGQQGGNPGNRFCCGDGQGQNPVDCTDARCNTGGFVCASPCCGDGMCGFGEGSCDCAPDCGTPPKVEVACQDGSDEDCDGPVDCADLDCCTVAICADGIDGDGDSVANCDCDDTSAAVWAQPGEARDLTVAHDAGSGASLLSWAPPVDLGGAAVSYAVLRSGTGSDFVTAAACVSLADPLQPQATDAASPSPGAAFCYLVRAENACPFGYGLGPLGTDSAGVPRGGRSCP